MTPALVWMLLGMLLILSELLATSVIAVFLGLGALATSFLLYWGWIEDLSWQFVVFSGVSLLTLLVARRRLQALFVGRTLRNNQPSEFLQQALGKRVEVVTTFQQGKGRVRLNGVDWTAYSDEDLVAGSVAWVSYNQGIDLYVTSTRPQ